MSDQREIFRHGRCEMCDVIYWPAKGQPVDYIIVRDGKGHELVCHQAMGTWCEMTPMDIISRLRFHDRNAVETRRHFTQPENP